MQMETNKFHRPLGVVESVLHVASSGAVERRAGLPPRTSSASLYTTSLRQPAIFSFMASSNINRRPLSSTSPSKISNPPSSSVRTRVPSAVLIEEKTCQGHPCLCSCSSSVLQKQRSSTESGAESGRSEIRRRREGNNLDVLDNTFRQGMQRKLITARFFDPDKRDAALLLMQKVDVVCSRSHQPSRRWKNCSLAQWTCFKAGGGERRSHFGGDLWNG